MTSNADETRRRSVLDGLAVAEKERSRMARELHDELGQRLLMLKTEMTSLSKLAAARQQIPHAKLALMDDLIERALQSMRKLVSGWDPAELKKRGLIAALESECREFQKKSGIVCTFKNSLSADPAFGDAARLAVYRIAQSALNNTLQHSNASWVVVALSQTDSEFEMRITDNGVGLLAGDARKPKSQGIRSMRERAEALGGTLAIGQSNASGAEIVLHVPSIMN